MTAAELILALQALPPETEVILSDLLDDDPVVEVYAKVSTVLVRHVAAFDLEHMNWDFTPTVSPHPGSVPVALIVSPISDHPERELISYDPQTGVKVFSLVTD